MLDPSAERFDRCGFWTWQTPADAISLIAKHELDWQLLISYIYGTAAVSMS
jgi:hypothetical protein